MRIIIFPLFICPVILLANIDKPEFSHTRDFYENPFALTLTSTIDNGVIRYTVDGSQPSCTTGRIYTVPISISRTCIVRAIVCKDGGTSSEIRTHTFIFLDDIIRQDNNGVPKPQHDRDHVYWTEAFDMTDVTQSEDEIRQAFQDIPTLSIAAAYDSLFGLSGILRGQNLMEGSGGKAGDPNDPNWHELVACSIEMIYPENIKFGKYKDWQENAGIKVQGGGGRWDNGYYDHKQSFTLEFKSQYGAATLHNDIFKSAPYNRTSSPGRFDKIILRAGHNKSWGADWDRENTVYTRDQLGRDLQLLMSGWGSHGTFVHLYLNGKYWGLYNPSERMDDNAMSIYFGGEDDHYYFGKGKGGDQSGNDDRYDDLCNTDWRHTPLSELSKYVAIDEYLDMCLLYCYANPGDGPQYYFGNRNSPAGPTYFTAWDIEDSFDGGSRRTGPPVAIEGMNLAGNDKFKAYFRMKDNPDFRMKFADRAYKHCYNHGVLTDKNVGVVWDSLCTYIEKAILCEIARWGDERGFVYDYAHWHKERLDVAHDIRGRANRLISVLRAAKMYPSVQPPNLKIAGERITETTINRDTPLQLEIEQVESTGITYYTIDGSDPRHWDLTGNPSPAAIQVTGQNEMLAVNDAAIVKVRTQKGDDWSPLHELRINQGSVTAIENYQILSNTNPDFLLHQNYPNPFNPETRIDYTLYSSSNVELSVYNLVGQKIATLVNGVEDAGNHHMVWNASKVPAGIYLYQIKINDRMDVKKMILTR